MASVFDVAQYILQQLNEVSALKLQKLVYYCQAWYLVWNNKQPLFNEQIEAWVNGPVVRELYNVHQGQRTINYLPYGSVLNLSQNEKICINRVLSAYKDKGALWLVAHSHQEAPWKNARHDLAACVPSNNIIGIDAIYTFYQGKNIEDMTRN